MPAIAAALAPTKPGSPVSCFCANEWIDSSFTSQGTEGRQLFEKAEEVSRQWGERAEVLLMLRQEADAFSYEHVPANRTFYVKTRYVYVGKGLPEPIDLDE